MIGERMQAKHVRTIIYGAVGVAQAVTLYLVTIGVFGAPEAALSGSLTALALGMAGFKALRPDGLPDLDDWEPDEPNWAWQLQPPKTVAWPDSEELLDMLLEDDELLELLDLLDDEAGKP